MNPDDLAQTLRAAVKEALLNTKLSTYVDEDQDVIDGPLSEVLSVVVRTTVQTLKESGLIADES